MSTKLVECTLGVKYRRHNPDGSVSGGPMYYLERYLADRGAPRLGKGLGGFYALALVIGCLGIGNMFQSNQAYVQFVTITGGEASFSLSGAGYLAWASRLRWAWSLLAVYAPSPGLRRILCRLWRCSTWRLHWSLSL